MSWFLIVVTLIVFDSGRVDPAEMRKLEMPDQDACEWVRRRIERQIPVRLYIDDRGWALVEYRVACKEEELEK